MNFRRTGALLRSFDIRSEAPEAHGTVEPPPRPADIPSGGIHADPESFEEPGEPNARQQRLLGSRGPSWKERRRSRTPVREPMAPRTPVYAPTPALPQPTAEELSRPPPPSADQIPIPEEADEEDATAGNSATSTTANSGDIACTDAPALDWTGIDPSANGEAGGSEECRNRNFQ